MPDYDGLSDKALLDLFLDLQAKQGQWSREIAKAMENGEIDWDELAVIQGEYNKFVVAGAEVMNRLRSFMAVTEETNSRKARK